MSVGSRRPERPDLVDINRDIAHVKRAAADADKFVFLRTQTNQNVADDFIIVENGDRSFASIERILPASTTLLIK